MQSIPREMNQEADSRKLSWRNKRRISLSFSSVFVIKIPKYQHKRSRIAKVYPTRNLLLLQLIAKVYFTWRGFSWSFAKVKPYNFAFFYSQNRHSL